MEDPLIAPLAADLAALAVLGGGEDPVPTCPGWTVSDLLLHAGSVAALAAACLRGGDDGERPRRPRPPEGTPPAEWLRSGAAALLSALAEVDADTPVPTFGGPEPARWWCRRQAAEMAVHRVDAELALGRMAPVDRAVAVAGIDEFLELVCGTWRRDALAGWSGSLHLHATDGDGEWTLRWTGDDVAWDHAHGRADVAVRADAPDLFLVLWQRPAAGPVEVLGDRAVLDRLLAGTAV